MDPISDDTLDGSPRARRARRFQLLLGSLLLLILAYPYAAALLPWARPNLVLRVLVLLAALLAVTGHRQIRQIGAVLCAVRIGSALWSEGGAAPTWLSMVGLGCELAFYVLTISVVTSAVFQRERVRADTLYGAACDYMLIGLAFGVAYELLEQAAPGSFALPQLASGAALEAELLYFSLVTFTTLGFGDVTPVSEAARSLVILQAVTGILFASVMIARLLSLYTAGRSEVGFERPSTPPLAPGLPRRFEILFALLLIQLVSYPYLPFAAIRAITVALLLAALYALATNRGRFWVGAALAAPALLAWIRPGDDPTSAVALVGRAGAAAYLLFATAALMQEVLRRGEVDRDVLFGAGCIYLLIGISWASLYDFVLALSPGSLSLPFATTSARSFLDLLYFSFITLTTTGYGDILPQTTAIRSLVVIQSVVGIFFPAVLVARLVSLYR